MHDFIQLSYATDYSLSDAEHRAEEICHSGKQSLWQLGVVRDCSSDRVDRGLLCSLRRAVAAEKEVESW